VPRGFKVDIQATFERFGYRWKRQRPPLSFMSMPKFIRDDVGSLMPHIIAYGDDKAPIRAEIFRRNREANGGENRCWKCGTTVFEIAPDEFCFAYVGEWHHLRNKSGQRCDCPENGVVACKACHIPEHPQVRWTGNRVPA
jgi:hypothetical protein